MNCTICCDHLKKNEVKLACGHSFHNNCLIQWLLGHDTCPICRYQINPKNNISDILNEDYEDEDEAELKIYINHVYSIDIENCMFNFAINVINVDDETWTRDYDYVDVDFRYIGGIVDKKINNVLTRLHIYIKNWNNTYVVYCALIETLIPILYYYKEQSKFNYISNHKSNRKCNKMRNQNYFRKRPKVY